MGASLVVHIVRHGPVQRTGAGEPLARQAGDGIPQPFGPGASATNPLTL